MTSIINIPAPTKETKPSQRSINISDIFLTRFSPPWSRPPSLPAYTWRNWVLNQPVAMAYRDVMIANILALEWKITPRDATYKKELDATIKYYAKLITNGGNYLGSDYTGLTEWIMGDLLDLPFGGAVEVGRKGDDPNGRVAWLRPLDAGTLYPTLNDDYPVVQYYQGYDAVAFPYWTIARTYLSPQSYIYREGWGMAPPEKAYFAISLLNSGDKYYANLLLDVPTAGILDLGDMEKDSAMEWATAFKTFVNDSNTSFRIPVLYEHNNPVKFLPFGKVPNDIMYDTITTRYAALLGAAYGMDVGDIGMQNPNQDTLAGSIRAERKTLRTGYARVKKKMKYFWDKILPPSLEFNFIDIDSENLLAMGRARLASATAMNLLQTNGNFSQQEVRSQFIQDGLVNISIPDKLPKDAKEKQEAKFWHDTLGNQNQDPNSQKKKPGEPETVGSPKAPSQGGEGDIKKMSSLTVKAKEKVLKSVIGDIVMQVTPKVLEALSGYGEDELYVVKSTVNNSLFDDDILGLQEVLSATMGKKSLVDLKYLKTDLEVLVGKENVERVEKSIKDGMNGFIARTVAFTLNDVLFDQDLIDRADSLQYDSIVEKVQGRVFDSLEDFVSVHVTDEINKINGIEMENEDA